MHLNNPWFLLLWIPLAVLMYLRERHPHIFKARLPFPETTAFKSLAPTWRSRSLALPRRLMYAALFLAIWALARPQTVLKGEEARAKGIDIMLVMDTSESMRALDFDPLDRMAAAIRAAKNFVTRRQHDRIGLTVFAGVSFLACPLTLDYAALVEYLDEVEVGMTGTQNTAIGSGIATALNHLKKSTAKSKILIVLTDGRSNAGEVDPVTAAKAAQSLGVKIYTIGVGIRGESKIPVNDPLWGKRLVPIQEDLDEPTLLEVARVTEGNYFRATSAKELDKIYAEIDQLEKTDVDAPTPAAYQDKYLMWLLWAMLLMGSGLILQRTIWRTLP